MGTEFRMQNGEKVYVYADAYSDYSRNWLGQASLTELGLTDVIDPNDTTKRRDDYYFSYMQAISENGDRFIQIVKMYDNALNVLESLETEEDENNPANGPMAYYNERLADAYGTDCEPEDFAKMVARILAAAKSRTAI